MVVPVKDVSNPFSNHSIDDVTDCPSALMLKMSWSTRQLKILDPLKFNDIDNGQMIEMNGNHITGRHTQPVHSNQTYEMIPWRQLIGHGTGLAIQICIASVDLSVYVADPKYLQLFCSPSTSDTVPSRSKGSPTP